MPDWLHNPHADYVLAAYGIALLLLAIIGIAAWRESARARVRWKEIERRNRQA